MISNEEQPALDTSEETLEADAPSDLAEVVGCLNRALRLLGVLQNAAESFTEEHFIQLCSDVAGSRDAVKAELAKPEPETTSGSPDLLSIVNRLPMGGRIILERSVPK